MLADHNLTNIESRVDPDSMMRMSISIVIKIFIRS